MAGSTLATSHPTTAPFWPGTVGLRPEAELLLCCARTAMDPETAARLRSLLREEIDWNDLLRFARSTGVLPLLYRQLNTTCCAAVPPAYMDQLRTQSRADALRNLVLARELLALLELFDVNGLEVIPFKGIVLAASTYGDLTLRKSGDVDLLICRRDAVRAKDLLLAQGYELETPLRACGMPLKAHADEYSFVDRAQQIFVELRWRIIQPHVSPSLDLEHLWERRRPLVLAGAVVPDLAPEDLLLILCAHGAKHGWSRLSWICDVAELVRAHPGLDWRQIDDRARKHGLGRMIALGLLLASQLLEAPVPEGIRRRAQRDTRLRFLAAQVCDWLFDPTDGSAGPKDDPEQHRFALRVTERAQDRIRYGLYLAQHHLTPNARDRALLRLPARLSALYYLLRPVRLLGEYGLAPYRRILHPGAPAPPSRATDQQSSEPEGRKSAPTGLATSD
jgi:hypothetical protein